MPIPTAERGLRPAGECWDTGSHTLDCLYSPQALSGGNWDTQKPQGGHLPSCFPSHSSPDRGVSGFNKPVKSML